MFMEYCNNAQILQNLQMRFVLDIWCAFHSFSPLRSSWWPESCEDHWKRQLSVPDKQSRLGRLCVISSSSSAPSPLVSLCKHDRIPYSLSEAPDRWNWGALREQHNETSGQARVIDGTNGVLWEAVWLTHSATMGCWFAWWYSLISGTKSKQSSTLNCKIGIILLFYKQQI